MKRLQRLIFWACAALAVAGNAFAAVPAAPAPAPASAPAMQLSTGDQIRMEVFGAPDLGATLNVAEDGTVRVPLAGPVPVAGLSPTEAGRRIEKALKDGEYFVNPQVTVTVAQSLSLRVSVLGEVQNPGRYPIESNSTVFDVIALAGGITEKGSERVLILRPDESGTVQRLPVDLRRIDGLQDSRPGSPNSLRGGDSILVPKGTFFIVGQVVSPGEYRIEGDMILFEAIARAGGVTPSGSASRVEIRRRGPDDQPVKVKINKSLRIEPGDVITVKERLF